ncbi:MAG: HD domain-containing protein [Erysipelotrichia bacterium]|nr:HD domain-containing protein [Erysipelotrichia bacterium]
MFNEKVYLLKVKKEAEDILLSEGMQKEKYLRHHGDITCYQHSLSVALVSLYLADKYKWRINEKSLIRGALLHDYYLYDWHVVDKSHRFHGFIHACKALKNAGRDFKLNDIEKDIIRKHMFPLNITLPKYRESWIVTLADKIVAFKEVTGSILAKLFWKNTIKI